jgi:hypothetical protein
VTLVKRLGARAQLTTLTARRALRKRKGRGACGPDPFGPGPRAIAVAYLLRANHPRRKIDTSDQRLAANVNAPAAIPSPPATARTV